MARAARRRASSRWRLPRLPLPRLALPGALGRWWGRRRWWSKILCGLFALLVLAPLALTVVYRVLPVPATPLMVLRLFEGEGWHRDWVPLERDRAGDGQGRGGGGGQPVLPA